MSPISTSSLAPVKSLHCRLSLLLTLLLAAASVQAQLSYLFTTSGQGGFLIIAGTTGSAAQWGGTTPGSPTSQPEPAPVVCTYSLGVASANLGGAAVGDTFQVFAPASCAWTAQSGASWIHTSSAGSGDGWVSYLLDANLTGALRTGTLTVGAQTFTVHQAPQGFIWHDVFGWLFTAGRGWYHADGLGWTWFHPGGQWIWSARLQGWLSITDYRARTAWSTQFGSVTFAANLPGRLESNALGPIYVGKYRGQTIPDGWVASDRLGYIWPNGDGLWFWSEGLGTWLGVAPGGGLWSVAEQRFL